MKLNLYIKISLFNLFIVALLGVLMRYKICFEFPFFDQKNIQHAHAHFAFAGWISHTIFSLITFLFIDNEYVKKFEKPILANLIFAYCMLVSFFVQGYGAVSIIFSVGSLLSNFYFAIQFFKYFYNIKTNNPAIKWFKSALIFNLISSIGTGYLGYMMMSKHIDQKLYLAAVYYYLHFQYNGWFLLSIFGLFVGFLFTQNIKISDRIPFILIVGCLIPTYFLSTLWLQLPLWLFLITAIGTIAQTLGWGLFVKKIFTIRTKIYSKVNYISYYLFVLVAMAMSVKIILQLFSTLPEVSKLAFGFRPIVIAYLHLVLLGIISIFLIAFILSNNLINFNKYVLYGVLIFVGGIILNEFVLMIQGVASFSYTSIPYMNITLFIISIIMLSGILLILKGIFSKQLKS